jgi:DNA mismatch repair protein MutL
MSIIRQLSPITISRIAAGEVVERPATAIKELIENAIDAKATDIKITVEAAGKNLIIAQDNGTGMDKDDLAIAVDRHTTSKLLDDDLLNIKSFGFRGEALPSIGSVSRLTIKSKVANSENAWCITVAGGEKTDLLPAMIPQGTIVEVRDLFFATPARLKFLRTERVELQHINDLVKRIALANPNIKFTLISDNNEIASYEISEDLIDRNYKRIEQILGKEFAENSINVDIIHDQIHIKGYTSLPTYNRGTSNDTYLYVNGRMVKDKILQIALKIAYQDFISHDRYPVAVLFINMPNEYVDVNVHPAKTEIRFRDVPLVRNAVISGLKNAIHKYGQKTSSTIALDTIVTMQKNIHLASLNKLNFTKNKFNQTSTYPANANILSKQLFEPVGQNFDSFTQNIPQNPTNEYPIKEINYPLGAAICQLHDTYIISQTNDSIIITDQHAAHERLIYEKLKQDILNGEIDKQRLLIPEIIDLDEFNIEKLLNIKEDLNKLGVSIEKYTKKSIIVHEIPHILSECNVRKLIQDIIDDLIEFDKNINFHELLNHVLATYACHHSIRAGRKMNIIEMSSLLREMENTPHSGQCNHGRPTYIELKLKDIEKLFGRS